MTSIIVPREGVDDYSTNGCHIALTERLMRAAEAVMYHGEHVEVLFAGNQEPRLCRLLRRGRRRDTVQLAIWTEHGRRVADRDVRFDEVLLPPATAIRLHQVAFEQDQLCFDDLPADSVASAVACGMLPAVSLLEEDGTPAPALLRSVVCNSCGLILTTFTDTTLAPGPLPPVLVKAIGCLCTLRPGWLKELVDDARAGRVREYGWQGRLLASLAVAGVERRQAAEIVRDAVPLRPELVTWAKQKLGRR